MIVVSNSSPLISLAQIGHLDLLPALFGSVQISVEVYAEVAVAGRGRPGAHQVLHEEWILVERTEPEMESGRLNPHLGLGEASAIALAQRLKADLILLDDKPARRMAREAGLNVTGCIGVLEEAFRKGLLPDLRDAYAAMIRERAYISQRLLNTRLGQFGLPPI